MARRGVEPPKPTPAAETPASVPASTAPAVEKAYDPMLG